MKVLSQTERIRRCWADSAIRLRSISFIIGLVGLSSQTARVFGVRADAKLSGFERSTKEKESPCRLKTLSNRRKVPPYTSSEHTTWSPEFSRCMITSAAALPDANAAPYFAPSKAARQSSSALRVGFLVRLYSYPLCSPGPVCA